jgi:hypothetical protein
MGLAAIPILYIAWSVWLLAMGVADRLILSKEVRYGRD